MDWWNLMKQSVTVGAQLLWSGRYGCNKGHYAFTIVMSHIEINKAVSQWLLTFNLCVSVTWPLTCAFHIPCTHTPEIIDMHRGMCDNIYIYFHGHLCPALLNKAQSTGVLLTCLLGLHTGLTKWHLTNKGYQSNTIQGSVAPVIYLCME